MSVTTITSDHAIKIEEHFKVTAGPGAGKTHWLVLHINNILRTSTRMGSCRKIACITYTNIAVETIIKRLNSTADRVDVSTIHGFIYANILKPYMSFIAKDYDFNVKKMDGHDDHFVSRTKLKEWIDNHPNNSRLTHPFTRNQLLQLPENLASLRSWIQSIHYILNGANIEIAVDNRKAFNLHAQTGLNKPTMDKLSADLISYKKIFWRSGRLHHDDILFFGYQLLTRYPFILKVLRAKFPYFVIDEFQDTSPIQTAIIKLLAGEETVVGIIGDKAQSIFSFQGASLTDFDSFVLPGQKVYEIEDNRRSTGLIIGLLNTLRNDIQQNATRSILGEKPVLIVGSRVDAFNHVRTICGVEPFITLSRENVMAKSMMRHYNSAIPATNLLDELLEKDKSNRAKTVLQCIKAVDFGMRNRFKEAIKEMERIVKSPEKDSRRKKAFEHLSILLAKYDTFEQAPLYDFYMLIKTYIEPGITNMVTGGIKTFYQSATFSQVAIFIETNIDHQESKTIHSAKGAEFDNVLVVLTEDKEIGYLMTPDLQQEEQRVRYVGYSRAKNRLFLTVPTITQNARLRLAPIFQILDI